MCFERLSVCVARIYSRIWSLLEPEIPDRNDSTVRKEHTIYFHSGDTERVNIRFHTLHEMRDGPYMLYARDGRVVRAASYREDKLEGEVVDYDTYVRGAGGELEKVKRLVSVFSGGKEVLSPE